MSSSTFEKLVNARLMRRVQDLEAELSRKDHTLQKCQQALNTAKAAFNDSETRVNESGNESNDKSWESFEIFFENRTEVLFSHGICIDCAKYCTATAFGFPKNSEFLPAPPPPENSSK